MALFDLGICVFDLIKGKYCFYDWLNGAWLTQMNDFFQWCRRCKGCTSNDFMHAKCAFERCHQSFDQGACWSQTPMTSEICTLLGHSLSGCAHRRYSRLRLGFGSALGCLLELVGAFGQSEQLQALQIWLKRLPSWSRGSCLRSLVNGSSCEKPLSNHKIDYPTCDLKGIIYDGNWLPDD